MAEAGGGATARWRAALPSFGALSPLVRVRVRVRVRARVRVRGRVRGRVKVNPNPSAPHAPGPAAWLRTSRSAG